MRKLLLGLILVLGFAGDVSAEVIKMDDVKLDSGYSYTEYFSTDYNQIITTRENLTEEAQYELANYIVELNNETCYKHICKTVEKKKLTPDVAEVLKNCKVCEIVFYLDSLNSHIMYIKEKNGIVTFHLWIW